MEVDTRGAIVAYGLVIEMGHLILMHVLSAWPDLEIICTGIYLAEFCAVRVCISFKDSATHSEHACRLR